MEREKQLESCEKGLMQTIKEKKKKKKKEGKKRKMKRRANFSRTGENEPSSLESSAKRGGERGP